MVPVSRAVHHHQPAPPKTWQGLRDASTCLFWLSEHGSQRCERKNRSRLSPFSLLFGSCFPFSTLFSLRFRDDSCFHYLWLRLGWWTRNVQLVSIAIPRKTAWLPINGRCACASYHHVTIDR